MRDVYVIGSAMTRFTKHRERTLRSPTEEAVQATLRDADMPAARVRAVYFSNAVGGLISGQETIRGQVALRHTGLLGGTITNVENACASGASAFRLAWMTVASEVARLAAQRVRCILAAPG